MRIRPRPLLCLALLGCGIDALGTLAIDGTTTPDGSAVTDGGASTGEDGGGETDGERTIDATAPDAEAGLAPVIYVTTAQKLYTFSPVTKSWSFVTDFSATCPEVDEAAVTASGELYASSSTKRWFYKFDPTTFACTKIADAGSTWSYAFTFVPKTTFATPTDTLVGYTFRDYIRMGLDGTASVIGSNALDVQMEPSGDMVSMGDRAFVSVFDSNECFLTDCLLEVDPKTGAIVKNWGNFPKDRVYALGHWGGKIYGFRSDATVYEVTLGTPITVVTYDGPDGGAAITGAGSSTAAPTQ